jgi:hypothetical protein
LSSWRRISGIALSTALMGVSFAAQDRTADLRARFSKESDPVHKAKLLTQLSDAEFHEIQSLIGAGNLAEASPIATELADEAESAVKALDARGRDAEKHPEGYKQVEISVRGSLRRIDNILVELSGDDQKPFLEVRTRLDELERKLIRNLFPHRPDAPPAQAEPKS